MSAYAFIFLAFLFFLFLGMSRCICFLLSFFVTVFLQMCGNGREPPCVMEGFTPSPINRAYVGSTAPFSELLV